MSDAKAKMFIRAIVVMLLLCMFWDVFGQIIELTKFCVEKQYEPEDVAMISGVLNALIATLMGYAFKILMDKKE